MREQDTRLTSKLKTNEKQTWVRAAVETQLREVIRKEQRQCAPMLCPTKVTLISSPGRSMPPWRMRRDTSRRSSSPRRRSGTT